MKYLPRKNCQSRKYKILVALASSVLTVAVCAAPGRLSDVPLYVGTGVTPNILYLVDDSMSMSFWILKSRGAQLAYPEPEILDSRISASYRNEWISYYDMVDIQTHEDVLRVCSGYNVLAYNPDVAYEPWAGYPNADFSAAKLDPTKALTADIDITVDYIYEEGNRVSRIEQTFINSVDLTDHKYMPWVDDAANGTQGQFDAGECSEDPASIDGTAIQPGSTLNALVGFSGALENTAATGIELKDYQKTNYANWFTYYRTRAYAMKSALTRVLATSNQRVGLATINGAIRHSVPVDAMTDTQRDELLSKAEDIGASGGTPLERALDHAGRYFAGLAPRSASDAEDVRPIFAENTPSPILTAGEGGSCQQNFTVLMTDGYSNANAIDAIGDQDGDGVSGHLGDIADYYYNTDLRGDLQNDVNSGNPLDTATHQHMTTYAVAFGVEGNFDPKALLRSANNSSVDTLDYLQNDSNWTITGFDGSAAHWPDDVTYSSPETIDDLFHATVNGRGNFFSSSNPEQLVRDLEEVEDSIASDARGTAASVGFNSTSTGNGTLLFKGWFNTANWQGNIEAFQIDNGISVDDGRLVWSAGDLLESRVAPNSAQPERDIITFNGSRGIPFRAPAGTDYRLPASNSLNETQLRDLLFDSPYSFTTGNSTQLAANKELLDAVVAFIRGDVTVDGAQIQGKFFRNRENGRVLGDIVHSSPVFVSVPNAPYPEFMEGQSDGYRSTFVDAQRNRNPVIYVGANDGMLHAFDARANGQGGQELFAYIPGLLFSEQAGQGLHHLTDESFYNSHVSYVDATPTTADVFVNGAWRTYLVGGLGAGGKGVYVLDITNPAGFSESSADSIVKMEFTHANMGYTVGRPQIAKLNNGEWAAIFGNGYNNDGSYKASLFILYLDGHEGSAGVPYREITTTIGSVSDCNLVDSECNGLSTPSIVDLNGDAIVDRVYAGDVQGNLWAFDISSTVASEWEIAHEDGATKEPLFTACRAALDSSGRCAAADRQPITTKPLVVAHPSQYSLTTDPNLLIAFGTGQYLADGDTYTEDLQSLYGVWDAGESAGGLQSSDLITQEMVYLPGTRNRSITRNPVDYSVSSGEEVFGWKIDMPELKERLVINPIKYGNSVIFTSTIPSNAMCAGGGSGFIMAVNFVDGGHPRFDVFPDREDSASAELPTAPGGSSIVDDRLVVPGYGGDLEVERLSGDTIRPSRRSSWSILK
ncbi:pilus assembly protein [Teredinibacter turnerae]|uniref:pilus assembly protein n=1 Tax=Teredinibacter turnerae TaxID=2426 RepID=UPI00037392DD|nr:PilC/PilY family type IV pilus protein [Teredinibacter turnerae]